LKPVLVADVVEAGDGPVSAVTVNDSNPRLRWKGAADLIAEEPVRRREADDALRRPMR
jgi:hypothetical protein